jgi:glycosyltransferase involved in cell wall biosynthesis
MTEAALDTTRPGTGTEAEATLTSLLVLIPCLNEDRTIGSVIARIPATIEGIGRIDVAVVDDGSTDDTARVAGEHGARVLRHGRNLGVGAALRTGLRHARIHDYDFVVNIDGDGQFAPEDIPEILAPVIAGEADLVTASRFADPDLVPDMPAIKKWGNRRISALVGYLTGQRLHDVSCGFRAYSAQTVRALNLVGNFTYTHEVILQACFQGFRVREVPVPVIGEREFGESRVASNLFRYARLSSRIIVSSFFYFHPMRVFGAISIVFLLPALAIGAFFLYHRFSTGEFTPHIWAGFASAFLFVLGCIAMMIGFIALLFQRLAIQLKQESDLILDMVNRRDP